VLAYVALILTPLGQQVENLALKGARQEIPDIKESSLLELHEISLSSFAVAIVVVMLVAVASVGLYLLARSGRVQPFPTSSRIGVLIATVILGGMALLFGGVGLIFGVGRLLPVPETPTRDDMLLAYTSTLLIGTAMIAFAFLAFFWLIRPFTIDDRSAAPGVGVEAG